MAGVTSQTIECASGLIGIGRSDSSILSPHSVQYCASSPAAEQVAGVTTSYGPGVWTCGTVVCGTVVCGTVVADAVVAAVFAAVVPGAAVPAVVAALSFLPQDAKQKTQRTRHRIKANARSSLFIQLFLQ